MLSLGVASAFDILNALLVAISSAVNGKDYLLGVAVADGEIYHTVIHLYSLLIYTDNLNHIAIAT